MLEIVGVPFAILFLNKEFHSQYTYVEQVLSFVHCAMFASSSKDSQCLFLEDSAESVLNSEVLATELPQRKILLKIKENPLSQDDSQRPCWLE